MSRHTKHRLRRKVGEVFLGVALGGWLAIAPVLAQQLAPEVIELFLADPTQDEVRDPLLPQPPIRRPLSPLEKLALEQQLDRLNQQAQQLLASGQTDAAFALWMREVRLRRTLSLTQELTALNRVAQYIWEQGRTYENQLVRARLQQLQAEALAAEPINLSLLGVVGSVYLTLRDQPGAVEVYRQIAAIQAERGNTAAQIVALEQVGLLQLDWFEHLAAAETYETLLAIAQQQNNSRAEETYLEAIVYSYSEAQAAAAAIPYQQQLIEVYQAQGNWVKIPQVQLGIARHYRALDQPNQALTFYRLAYAGAQASQQYDYGSQVLRELGEIYQTLGQLETALDIYRILLQVERQTYNAYGIMSAFDQIGQIYRRQGNTTAARAAFQEALILANQLSHQERYFQAQLRSLATPYPPDAVESEGWRSGSTLDES
ncbi:tetratricopeptide repeat protein [Almyronema epifaneia]|uniref:Tetratricopeptide repeat protein n=1 Tax=Almyronema epifaneia S1 TaxID=2991925 RepID=A0ABW6IHV8_9CYAN